MSAKVIPITGARDQRDERRRRTRRENDKRRRTAEQRIEVLGTPVHEAQVLALELQKLLEILAPAIRTDALRLEAPIDREALFRLERFIGWQKLQTSRFERELELLRAAAARQGAF